MIYALILLGLIIFVHEFGHFLAAKLLGVRVEKFSIGFGPKIIGRKYKETQYQIAALPLGGYVKMLGETSQVDLSDEEKQFALSTQPVWKKAIIVSAGALFNIVFSFFLLTYLFNNGIPTLIPEIGQVQPGTPAEKAGLMKGDIIHSIQGKQYQQWDMATALIHENAGKELLFTIKRGGKTFDVTIVPGERTVEDIFKKAHTVGLIGIMPSGKTVTQSVPIGSAVIYGFRKTWDLCYVTLMSIAKLIERVIPLDTVGGPIAIVQMANTTAEKGVMSLVSFAAVIGINIGVLNLLPIPILDGGHLLFYAIEAIRKKPLQEKTMIRCQKVGLAVLLCITVVAFYNDLSRLFTGGILK